MILLSAKTYRHHGPRARARHKHPARVSRVRIERIRYHVRNGIAVPAAVVRERCVRADIPAAALVRRLRVDDDEVVLLRQARPLRVLVVRLRRARTVVDGDDDGGVGLEVVRDVDVHEGARRVVAKVGDWFQLGGAHGTDQAKSRGEVLFESHDGSKDGQ